jgi:hypothetical protein
MPDPLKSAVPDPLEMPATDAEWLERELERLRQREECRQRQKRLSRKVALAVRVGLLLLWVAMLCLFLFSLWG